MDEPSVDTDHPSQSNDDTVPSRSISDAEEPPTGAESEDQREWKPERDCDTPLMEEAPDSDSSMPTVNEQIGSVETTLSSTVESVMPKLFDVGEAKPLIMSASESEIVQSSDTTSTKPTVPYVDCTRPNPIGVAETIKTNKPDNMLANGLASSDTKIPPIHSKPSTSKGVSTESIRSQEGFQIAVTYDGDIYTCIECGYSNKGHHFEEHLMCHLIAKPYQCLYCKESFGTRKAIIKHLADVHKGKKLNCMLKALNRAKHLMQDAQKTNSCVFYALIPPFPHQPKKNLSSGSTASISSLNRSSVEGSSGETSPLSRSRQISTVGEGGEQELSQPKAQPLGHSESHQEKDNRLPSEEKATDQLSEKRDDEQPSMETNSEVPSEEKESDLEKNENKPTLEGKDTEQSSKAKSTLDIEWPQEEKDTAQPSEEQGSSSDDRKDINAELGVTMHEGDADAENIERVQKEGCIDDVKTTPIGTSEASEDFKETVNSTETLDKNFQGNDKTVCSESKCFSKDKQDINSVHIKYSQNATGDSVDPHFEDKCDAADEVVDANDVATSKDVPMEESSNSPFIDRSVEEKCSPEKTTTTEEHIALLESSDLNAQRKKNADQEQVACKVDGNSDVLEDIQSDTSVTNEKQSKEAVDVNNEKEDNQSAGEDESSQKEDSDKQIEETDAADTSESTSTLQESRKALIRSGSMSIKIVAAYSLDEDDFPEENNQSSEGQSAESAEKYDGKSSGVDLSDVVIDVFKDGRITVHNAKDASPSKESQVPEKDCKPLQEELRPHQTKLCQLLTGTATIPFPTRCTPTPATQPTPASSVPGISEAQMKHMRNPNFYVCGLNCNFSCLNSVDFREHLFLGHAGEKSFPCYYCGWMSHTEESLLRHITNHAHTYSKTAPLYLCGIYRCKFGTNLLSDLLNHMQILHQDIRMYICKECSETFNDVKDLVSHFEDNFIHVVNCPHCACKGTDRRMILKHIAEYHPGKAKMVSVAKQIICKDRKANNYKKIRDQYKGNGAKTLPASSGCSSETLINVAPSDGSYTTLKKGLTDIQIKIENIEDASTYDSATTSPCRQSCNISKAVSPPEKVIKAPKCSHCTFVARDQRRVESHMKCHGLPVIKRHRFRCLYCPQGFDSSQKFKLHINCHPGLIKYWMYYCKRCDFDSNQRYVMLRHIRTRDELHANDGNEEDMFSVVERIMESRVLECEHCNYQTRHKLHLQIHYQREHREVKPSIRSSCLKQQTPWISPPKQLSNDSHKENASKKFKCPFCRYLVPKAADLKSHVKKHANLGKITLDFLRCRYCSLSSTAREIVYDHIREKHRGKPLIVVRKTVTIDTSGNDNTFSETSVTEAPMIEEMDTPTSQHGVDKFQCETCSFVTVDRREFEAHVQLHNVAKGGLASMSMDDESDEEDGEEENGLTGVDHPQPCADDHVIKSDPDATVDHIEQVYVIPETVAEDQISTPARCCSCYYASAYRTTFVDHMTTNHPNVMIVIRKKGTTVEQTCPTGKMLFGLPTTLNNEVLLVPDRQVFTQAVQCPKCPNFTTYFRRNLVLHLSKDHPEITAMGKCTWPGWQKTSGSCFRPPTAEKKPILNIPKRSVSPEKQDESCIIGSGDLDEQIGCLYKNFGDRQQCLICNSVKPKKFFMHIHLLRHLNIFLVGCPYCPHKGLQKYKVGRHIKMNHPGRERVVLEINHDISQIVSDFLAHQKKVVTAAAASPAKRSPSTLLNFKPFAKSSSEKDMSVSTKLSGPLGTPYLDEKLLCLYTCVEGKNKCSLCCVEFARKYAIHRHLVVNHLKVSLLKCGHCGFEGVEKHVIIDHILEQHKNQTIKFEPLNIDMEQKVQDFLNTYNVVKPEPVAARVKTEIAVSSTKMVGPQSYCLGKDKLHGKLKPLFTIKGSSFKCNLCKWKFPRKYAIHRHILMKHLKIGLYGCTHCHVQGAERYLVVAHMKEAHPKVTPQARILEVDMGRRIQDVLLEAASGVECHTAGNMPFPDAGNNHDDFTSCLDVKKEEMESGSTEDNKSQMVVAMFGKKRKPSSEYDTVSSYENPVTPKKLKTTSRMVDVTTEIRVVCVEDGTFKKYVCEKCRFTSLHRSNVYRHVLRIHEKYREQQCPLCGYKTYSKFLLDQHIEVEHEGCTPAQSLENSQQAEISVKMEPGLEEECKQEPLQVKHYACAYCNYETQTAEAIIKHTRDNHALGGGETSGSSSAAEPSTSNQETDSLLNDVSVKKSHVKRGTFTENQMLFCGYCTFKAPGVQALKDHHKATHATSKLCIISPQPWRYICRVCGLKNNAGGKMRCHINRHLEYRPYTCMSCSQAYASTDELRKHIRNLQHSDQCRYIKQDKKEQKVSRFLEESRKNALLVNVGAPPDDSTIQSVKVSKVPSTDEKLNFKEPKPLFKESKFKGIKRAMKMPMSPAKALKKNYWKKGLDRESKAVTKDIACYWCDVPRTVSVDQMKRHKCQEHPDKEFLWVDTRQGNTCTDTGEILSTVSVTVQPSIAELYTSKQLSNHKMKYYCTRCAFSAWYLPAMVSHCRCHLPKKYLCAYCHLRYSNRDYLEKHQQTFHPGHGIWVLHMVKNTVDDKTTTGVAAKVPVDVKLEEPMDTQEAAEAEECLGPVEERRASQNVMYCCNYCLYENESLYQYRLHLVVHGTFRHLKTDISTDSPLKCGFCPYIATHQADFSMHIQTHFENRSYKCGHCNYSAYTRAHVRYHCANQHPDSEVDVIDLSSAASYVEYLKLDKTNLPKLVDLDPRVVLRDITSMNQNDLEELMTSEMKMGLRTNTMSGDDGMLDESFEECPIECSVEGTSSEGVIPEGLDNQASWHSPPAAGNTDRAACEVEEETTYQVSPRVEDEEESCQIQGASREEVKMTPSPTDKGHHSAMVSSSIGDPESVVGDSFDMAEVSAFTGGVSLGHPVEEPSEVPKSLGNVVDGSAPCNVREMNTKVIIDENVEQISVPATGDGNMEGEHESLVVAEASTDTLERETSPDKEKVKKEESANVFDTLHSWLGLK